MFQKIHNFYHQNYKPYYKLSYFSFKASSLYNNLNSAYNSFYLLGSTINKASYVSIQALIHCDKLPAGSLTLNTLSLLKSGLVYFFIYITQIFLIFSIIFGFIALIFSSLNYWILLINLLFNIVLLAYSQKSYTFPLLGS